MNDDIIKNYQGGKVLETINWPFIRYKILLPKESKIDIFVWLYLSLISHNNGVRGYLETNYSEDVKNDTRRLIEQKFGDIIDNEMLKQIISNAEIKFVTEGKKLKEGTLPFLNSYDTLLLSSLEVKYIFQDGITGNVLPLFYDMVDLEDTGLKDKYRGDEVKTLSFKERLHIPTKRAMKRAYTRHIQLKNNKNINIDEQFDYESYYDDESVLEDDFDEDAPVFLEDNDLVFEDPSETKKELKSIDNYNVIFLDTGLKFYFDVNVKLDMNKLVFDSPFGPQTNAWMKSCFEKGRNSHKGLDEIAIRLDKNIIPEKRISEFFEYEKSGIHSRLKNCGEIYRMVDGYNNDVLRMIVLQMEESYSKRNLFFFQFAAQLLELIMQLLDFNKSTPEFRDNTDYVLYKTMMKNKFDDYDVDGKRLMAENIFNNWKNKYKTLKGKESFSFKSDIADLFLVTDILDSSLVVKESINELFEIYNLRNEVAHPNVHYGISHLKKKIEPNYLEKIERSVKILNEIAIGGQNNGKK